MALLVTRAFRTWSMSRRAALWLAMPNPVLVSIPTSGCGGLRLGRGPRVLVPCPKASTKPMPRWDVHFGEIDDDRKDSTAPHITFGPQLGGHR